ncbi:MAG: hypothetical protein A2V70_16355 [Planctomycetes bacterium RBG_13_63_9]|nr:MAG: hypothetical protein A2V70_16355 [Planctomycetes bacterium RBG_13_63_9]
MPKLLVNRFTDDSVGQFRVAAHIRNEDAWHLATSGRGAAAIYLWGYAAEMTVKAAWFDLIGFPESKTISTSDLRKAIEVAKNDYGISWRHGLHNIVHWAELLIEHRIHLGQSYPNPCFGSEVVKNCLRVHERWRVILRYKKNQAYPFEVHAVAVSTQWLLSNALRL